MLTYKIKYDKIILSFFEVKMSELKDELLKVLEKIISQVEDISEEEISWFYEKYKKELLQLVLSLNRMKSLKLEKNERIFHVEDSNKTIYGRYKVEWKLDKK
jgi:dsDNA-binding SOS-regulon protein